MMLDQLVTYADREGLMVKPGFKPKTVRWLLVFSPEGRFLGVQDLRGDDLRGRGRQFEVCPDLTQQEMVAAGAGCRHFLVDSADVVAFVTKDGAVNEKLTAKHEFFVGLLRRASSCVPELSRIAATLSDPNALEAIRDGLTVCKAKPTELVTFAATSSDGDTSIIVDRNDWHEWWLSFRTSLSEFRKAKSSSRRTRGSEVATPKMRCLLSGELIDPQPTHNKIEGLADVGGLSMGDALTSFDKDAFASFGLDQGANAAMSETMVKTYTAALNDLIRRRSHRLAGVKIVYWYSGRMEEQYDALAEVLEGIGFPESPDNGADKEGEREHASKAREQAQAVSRATKALEAIRSGERPELGDFRYFAFTLSANSGRVVIRDWMEGRFEELVMAVESWFDDLAIVHRDGRGAVSTHKFAAVLAAPVRDLKDAPAPLAATLWHCAVKRHPIPYEVMAATLGRVRIDLIQGESPRHARFGLLKSFCNRNERIPNMTTHLNEHETHPAYLCGRIMALLEQIQYRALGDVGAGVAQRYYAAASATPALVLGRLVRLALTGHLPKIEPTPLRIWFDNRLAEVWNLLQQAPPATLKLEEQTLFAMGYYQQKAHRPEPKEASGSSNSTHE